MTDLTFSIRCPRFVRRLITDVMRDELTTGYGSVNHLVFRVIRKSESRLTELEAAIATLSAESDDAGREVDANRGARPDEEGRASSVVADYDDDRLPGFGDFVQVVVDRLCDIDGNIKRLASVVDDRGLDRFYTARHYSSPSVVGCGDLTVGEGEVAGVEHTAPATNANNVTDEMIAAVADHLISAGSTDEEVINLLCAAAAQAGATTTSAQDGAK